VLQKKIARMTGVTRQDGAYSAEFLPNKGYEVPQIKRRRSPLIADRIDHLYQVPLATGRKFMLHLGDITTLRKLVQEMVQAVHTRRARRDGEASRPPCIRLSGILHHA